MGMTEAVIVGGGRFTAVAEAVKMPASCSGLAEINQPASTRQPITHIQMKDEGWSTFPAGIAAISFR